MTQRIIPLTEEAKAELREVLVRACQATGFCTDDTYERIDEVVESVVADVEELTGPDAWEGGFAENH